MSPLLRDKFSYVVSKWDNKIITNILEWKCGQLADHLVAKNLTKSPQEMYNKYTKLKCLEGFIGNLVSKLKKAAPRFESGGDLKELSYN